MEELDHACQLTRFVYRIYDFGDLSASKERVLLREPEMSTRHLCHIELLEDKQT
jgi:hypothetical protein